MQFIVFISKGRRIALRASAGVVCAGALVAGGVYNVGSKFFSLAGVGFWLGVLALIAPAIIWLALHEALDAETNAALAPPVFTESERKCPMCAEWIKWQATRCRYCQAEIRPGDLQAESPSASDAA